MKQIKQQPVPLKEEDIIEGKLVTTQKDAEEWKNKYLRALADYQNLVKRTEGDMQDMRLYATEQFLKKLLPVVDTLEIAMHHVKNEGLDLAMKELHAVLNAYGVEKIEVAGIPFDPHVMECIEVIDGEKDHVVKVLNAGYRMHGKLLRPSKVQVGGGIKGGTYV
jgi:molecular chaperone GrpE